MLLFVRAVLAMAAGLLMGADAPTVCSNKTWTGQGRFYTFWHDSGSACMTIHAPGNYSVDWQLGERGNLVVGEGWQKGAADRVVHYRVRSFEPGSNGYLSLYGWSRSPLVEYYIVENWGGFVPPGANASFVGSVYSDGGTYRVYRTQRIDQPSIAGTATFYQYWSVRTTRRLIGATSTITFGNHVAEWRKLGLRLGKLDYQIVATEGFGSSGRSQITVDRR